MIMYIFLTFRKDFGHGEKSYKCYMWQKKPVTWISTDDFPERHGVESGLGENQKLQGGDEMFPI